MGQYWKAVNVDDMESYQPDGIKLMEHAYFDNEGVNSVLSLLIKRWFGKRVAWVGDYYDDEPELYQADEIKNFSIGEFRSGIIVNSDLKEYVNLEKYLSNITEKYRDEWGYCHPLPLLLACNSNGNGGGDYRHWTRDDYEYVGRWFKCRLQFHPELSSFDEPGYVEILPEFSESKPYSEMTMDDFNHKEIAVALVVSWKETFESLTVPEIISSLNDKRYYALVSYAIPFVRNEKVLEYVNSQVIPKIEPKDVRDSVDPEKMARNFDDQPNVKFMSSDGEFEKVFHIDGHKVHVYKS